MDPVVKQSIVDIAADQIIEFLKSDEIHLGEKLPVEREMCENLNISRATLREAYRKLHSQGFVDLKPGRGAFVKNKEQNILEKATRWFRENDAQLQSYLEVRLYLDPLSAKLAANNRTNRDISYLREIQQAFEVAVNNKDNIEMARLDAELHKAIVDISNNDLLKALVNIINYYFEQLRQTSFTIDSHAQHAIGPHRKIIDAIANGDARTAELESINHMGKALFDLCGIQTTTPQFN